MHFIFYCRDKAGHEQVRANARMAHLDYLEAYRDRLLCAGPLLADPSGTHMVGSLLILDLDDPAAAESFAANDPYAKAGLFESVTIHPWRKVFPKS